MIGRIRGTLIDNADNFILVDVSGVGYEIEVPLSTSSNLDALNAIVTIHTHMVVREDAQLLFGFSTLSERALFRSLIKVNGVGPKLAIAILSGLNVADFCRCVINDDVKSLVALPGVGKKTAERLIIELRDRLPMNDINALSDVKNVVKNDHRRDAEAALIGLGFRSVDASRALAMIDDDSASIETLIKRALKNLT